MSQVIAINVTEKIATTDFREVVSFNSVYSLKFTFDGEWSEFSQRVAVVLWADGCSEKVFTGTECEMPVIFSSVCDTALLGVYSVNGDRRIASTFIRLHCQAGAHSERGEIPNESLQEQILSLVNEKDWSVFNEKMEEGVYSAVRVNSIGLVTEGKRIIEVGGDGQAVPSADLADGGIFFRRENGVCAACYYKDGELEELAVAGNGENGFGGYGYALTIGGKSYNGSAAVTVTASDLGIPSPSSLYSGQAIVVNSAGSGFTFGGAPVSSVNGQSGVVTISKYDLGLAAVAISGSYSDLTDNPIPTPSSIYKGQAIVVNSTGSGFTFGGAPVSSVNGQSGVVTISKYDLGLAAVAISGSYSDLTDNPIPTPSSIYSGQAVVVNGTGDGFSFGGAPVSSVNGQSGVVTITKASLGLTYLTSHRQMPLGRAVEKGVNFNELVETFFYYVHGDTQNVCMNGPTSSANPSNSDCDWCLLTINQGGEGAYLTQFAVSLRSDCAIRIRNRTNSVWTAWKTVI